MDIRFFSHILYAQICCVQLILAQEYNTGSELKGYPNKSNSSSLDKFNLEYYDIFRIGAAIRNDKILNNLNERNIGVRSPASSGFTLGEKDGKLVESIQNYLDELQILKSALISSIAFDLIDEAILQHELGASQILKLQQNHEGKRKDPSEKEPSEDLYDVPYQDRSLIDPRLKRLFGFIHCSGWGSSCTKHMDRQQSAPSSSRSKPAAAAPTMKPAEPTNLENGTPRTDETTEKNKPEVTSPRRMRGNRFWSGYAQIPHIFPLSSGTWAPGRKRTSDITSSKVKTNERRDDLINPQTRAVAIGKLAGLLQHELPTEYSSDADMTPTKRWWPNVDLYDRLFRRYYRQFR